MRDHYNQCFRFYCFLTSLLLLNGVNLKAQSLSFRKINSGTKSDILSIQQDKKQGVYFLTDKIYSLDRDQWKKVDLPVEGRILSFFPLSASDIWFAVIPFTSTCMLYHFHDGITVNIRPPFSNYITAMHFVSDDQAFFASITDIAVYDKGTFRMLPPSPARNNIKKVFSTDLTSFWALTDYGELFFYERGKYKRVLSDKKINDFCFEDLQHGYLLSDGFLYKVSGSEISTACESKALRTLNRMTLLKNNTLLLVGKAGIVMSYFHGHLTSQGSLCKEYLTGLVSDAFGNEWISGKNGRLFYHGAGIFPEYNEDNQGFSSHKLSSIGLSADDEYGVAMADFDGDGKTDIYTVRIYEQNRLYINNIFSSDLVPEPLGFTEEVVRRNANGVINPEKTPAHNEIKLGISAVDIDNDGDQDIYLCYLNSNNRLLLNRGNGYFRNVSEQKQRACEKMHRSNAAAFADVDNDGDLDLFVTNEEGSNRLFENNGTGHFTDITATSGLGSVSGGMCASFSDVNNDGLPDLCVSFWYPSNRIYFNDSKRGKIHFRDVTNLTGLAGAPPSKSNAVAFADVNNDGFTDLFIANRNTGNKFYLNNGKGIFIDRTAEYFEPEKYMTNGAVFADFDLDGYQDLYITNVGENVLYKNMNGKYFKDVTAVFGAELSGYCTGCATGDIDNDGDPDLYAANYINGNSLLFLNISEKKSFVKVRLHGVRSNRDAIGTKVWLYEELPGKRMVLAGYRELNGGGGYASLSAKEMIFGVVKGRSYFALVKFPSSADTLRIDRIEAGRTLEISEQKGFQAFYIRRLSRAVHFIKDQENQPEIIKYLLIMLLLAGYNLWLRGSNRRITLIRGLAGGVIFLVFILINRFFLFAGLSLSFFVAPVIVLGLLAIVHLFIGRILLRRLAQKEKLDLREKLSRDLHDDLASTLGSISIYAETLKGMKEPSQSDFRKLSNKVAELTQSSLQSISDIIWMTSPRNDSLQSLISKTGNYLQDVLTDNKINYLADVDVPDEPIILEEKIRNDAFLIMKEGLHNIIRHSGAGNVEFRAAVRENLCEISLKDDGVGFSDTLQVKTGSHGNGLVNMHRRAQESGIE